jgi:hypothetical protein
LPSGEGDPKKRLLLLLTTIIVLLLACNVEAEIFHYQPSANFVVSKSVARQTGTQPDFQIQIQPNQFLMRHNTTALPSVVLTGLDGFVGNISLTGAVAPSGSSAPTVYFFPPKVMLNASSGSPYCDMHVNTTLTTQPGLYEITVIATSGSIAHSATAKVGVTSVSVPANGAELVYTGKFTDVAYVGRIVTLNSTFLDLGYVSLGVTNLTITSSFGTYKLAESESPGSIPTCPIPLCAFVSLDPYQEATKLVDILIPAGTNPGNYSVTAIISWTLEPNSIYQQSAPDIVTHGYLTVYPAPASPPTPQHPKGLTPVDLLNRFSWIWLLIGVVALMIIIVGVVIWHQRNRNIAAKDQLEDPKPSPNVPFDRETSNTG